MNPFLEMMRTIHSSPYYDQMVRFSQPLYDQLGVNHFWYYRISHSGSYSYVGTHAQWSEYCFAHGLIRHFPCLRHPKVLRKGISLMKPGLLDDKYADVQQIAWDQFHINFNLNLFEFIPDGIEAFGFGTRFNDRGSDERLLNEYSLLRYFTKIFRERHAKLFHLLEDNPVDLSSQFGAVFFERPKEISLPFDRVLFLQKIGCEKFLYLTQREKDILKYLAHGFPASYIRNEIHLGIRTVENYIAAIKDKLSCRSKVELIKKAQEIATTGFLDA